MITSFVFAVVNIAPVFLEVRLLVWRYPPRDVYGYLVLGVVRVDPHGLAAFETRHHAAKTYSIYIKGS